ncbi:MAG: bifunctional oligoribonuclease/PAP phosphatase NrnA [Campylobacterota bacterium]|nr:bifunctional oligoribonuclease/PAP phosphatase NrnA [Campylobacterota bacterium]
MHQILEKIKSARHIVLITHINPDADSMGSASAFYSYILQIQKKVSLFSSTKKIDTRLRFLPWCETLKHQIPPSCDLAISFDCASMKRLGSELSIDLINFDHHKSNEHFAMLNIVDPNAIATTQVVYDYFISQGVKINPKMATALYAGLLDDSQNFISDKTDARSFDMAKVLLEKGADKEKVVSHLFQTSSLSGLRLKGLMLSAMQLYGDASIVVHKVSKEMLDSCGAKVSDCEAALEESLFLPTVKVSLLVCEHAHDSLKGSIRTDGTIDASLIARRYDGGGHLKSAGFYCHNITIEDACKNLIKDILEKKR